MYSLNRAVLFVVLAVGPAASAADRVIRFDVDNNTGDKILEVYVTPTRSPKWGTNLLKQGVLQVGRRATLSFAGACGLYDVRLVAPGGKEYLDDEVSFCEEHDVLTLGAAEITKARRSEQK